MNACITGLKAASNLIMAPINAAIAFVLLHHGVAPNRRAVMDVTGPGDGPDCGSE